MVTKLISENMLNDDKKRKVCYAMEKVRKSTFKLVSNKQYVGKK